MFELLGAVLLFVLIVWAVRYLLGAFDPGPQIAAVVYVLVVVVGVLYLLDLSGLVSVPIGHLHR